MERGFCQEIAGGSWGVAHRALAQVSQDARHRRFIPQHCRVEKALASKTVGSTYEISRQSTLFLHSMCCGLRAFPLSLPYGVQEAISESLIEESWERWHPLLVPVPERLRKVISEF